MTAYLINRTAQTTFRKPDRNGEIELSKLESPDRLVWIPEQKKIYVTDSRSSNIYVYRLDGSLVSVIKPRGYMEKGFLSADSICAYEGGLLVADRLQRTVFFYSGRGNCGGEAIRDQLPIEFVPGEAVGFRDGRFAVLDNNGNVLYVFSHSGRLIKKIVDTKKNLFAGSSGLCASGGRVFGFDYIYNELVTIDVDVGKVERKKLTYEQTSQLLPQGIVYVSGAFYTAEPLFSRVFAFNSSGNMIGEFGDTMNDRTALKMPVDISFTGKHFLVLEKEGKRISIWKKR